MSIETPKLAGDSQPKTNKVTGDDLGTEALASKRVDRPSLVQRLLHHIMPPGENLSWAIRGMALIWGIFALSLLITARSLQPAVDGFGTHQQLGLPPCTSIYVWGVRCPACGMTTSWAWFVRLDFLAAAQSNLGGLMLAIIALAYVPASCYFFVRGKASPRGWFSMALALLLTASLLAATIQWSLR